MLTYTHDSIFESDAVALVNPVNCVGVMGRGVAAEFKQRYPKMFGEYRVDCYRGFVHPGRVRFYRAADKIIANIATKDKWRGPAELRWVDAGLNDFCRMYSGYGITSVSFPQIGCGAGGLSWVQVWPLMEDYLSDLPIQVTIHIYEPNGG